MFRLFTKKKISILMMLLVKLFLSACDQLNILRVTGTILEETHLSNTAPLELRAKCTLTPNGVLQLVLK